MAKLFCGSGYLLTKICAGIPLANKITCQDVNYNFIFFRSVPLPGPVLAPPWVNVPPVESHCSLQYNSPQKINSTTGFCLMKLTTDKTTCTSKKQLHWIRLHIFRLVRCQVIYKLKPLTSNSTDSWYRFIQSSTAKIHLQTNDM